MEYKKIVGYALIPIATFALGLGIGAFKGKEVGANGMKIAIENSLQDRINSMQNTAFDNKNFDLFDCEISELNGMLYLLRTDDMNTGRKVAKQEPFVLIEE
ncbi:hypothetical protein J4468_04310 [Candidatus Woesearchaeota archaeon]|nr:hypothetical protein [Candidatus Woesearchaeota archaeon]